MGKEKECQDLLLKALKGARLRFVVSEQEKKHTPRVFILQPIMGSASANRTKKKTARKHVQGFEPRSLNI